MIGDPRARATHFALRPRLVVKYVAQLLGMVGLLCVVPALVCAVAGETVASWRFAAVVAALGAAGLTLGRLDCPDDLQANEALAVSALVYLLPSALLAWPLSAYGIAPLDAWFESVSSLTTTGLSTLASVEPLPYSFHFARAWLQWTGGLGIAVLALALLLQPGAASSELGFDRRETENLAGGTRAHALRVLTSYGALTAAGIVLVWALLGDFGAAVVHVLAAVSTGGFAAHDDSLAGLNAPGAVAALLGLALLAAAPFYIWAAVVQRRWRAVWDDRQLRTLLAGAAIVAVGLFVLLPAADGDSLSARAGHALALAVSAQSTAGFETLPVTSLGNGALLLLLVAMLVGGAMGSTAGGIKSLRFLLMLKLVRLQLLRATTSRSTVLELRLGRDRVMPREVESMMALVALFGAALMLSWGAFLIGGHAPLASLFEVGSALTTSGLSAGVAGPALAPALKVVLCIDMLLGRVEIVALLVLVLPGSWIGRRRAS